MEPFWKRRYDDVKEGGWSSVVTIIKYTISVRAWVPGIILAVPFVLIVRLLRPFIWFRFGNINSDRIGHFAYDVEYYLSEKEVGLHKGTHDIFFFGRKPANLQFAKMCSRVLTINSFAQYLWRANDLIPGGEKYVVKMPTRTNDYRDVLGLFGKTKTHLPFTAEEDVQGREFLKRVGCGPNEKFVCLMVRDSSYLSQKYGIDVSHHNYRDSDISDYEQAALFLANKGYWVFRMGKTVHAPFNVNHPRILDYANTEYRGDFLDIWLMANCFFCVSTSTGLDSVCMVYRRPVVYVNFGTFNRMPLFQDTVIVPTYYYWKDKDSPLTFEECYKHSYMRSEEFMEAGIDLRRLSAEEITEAVVEMEARLNGTWVDDKEDAVLQGRFMNQYTSHPDFHKLHGWVSPGFRAGAHFLKNNRALLE